LGGKASAPNDSPAKEGKATAPTAGAATEKKAATSVG